jgi:gas vesicle protein
MNAPQQEPRDHGFMIGLMTGTVVGAGLALWLAPRSGALRQRVFESVNGLGRQASDHYHQASTRLTDKVDELVQHGQDVRDELADRVAKGAHEVARGAHEVERAATAAKSNRT